MKKIYIGLFLTIVAIAILFAFKDFFLAKKASTPTPDQPTNQNNAASDSSSTAQNSPSAQNVQNPSGFRLPLDRAGERVTKKPFGIFITPQNSPVQPERFRGYHTGADFEIFPDELNAEVPVFAVCSGTLKLKEYATGYGGVTIESCTLDNQPVTVVYGHLKLASITLTAGQSINAADKLGILGAAYSQETNGERKHLHLGFHKGTSINILGYVQTKTDLSGWIDPCLYVCHN